MRHSLPKYILSAAIIALAVLCPTLCCAQSGRLPVKQMHATSDSIATAPVDSIAALRSDSIAIAVGTAKEELQGAAAVDSIMQAIEESPYDRWEERETEFNPDPTRAVWMSALFPGLGQLYNRRYWKLPIVIGGFMGLAYATSWNNGMLNDYTKAYRDIMDSDPTTKSYMDFFPPTTQESDLDREWLTKILQSRKNFYRRNRDLCIIAIIGVYFVAMVDAYVDASLSHFDITPDLSINVSPALFKQDFSSKPTFGMVWALTF